MAKLTDPEKLAVYTQVLENWSYKDFINYTPLADAWLRGNLERCTQKTMNKLIYDYMLGGGEIDEVVETRPEWNGLWDFHYDLRPAFRRRTLYFETRLCLNPFKPDDDATILVANLHWA